MPRPSPFGLRMRQILEQRGPLPSGAPATDATRPQIVRWLLDNLHHEEAVLQMEQKLLPLWEKKGMGGTTAAKMGEELNRALDALSAPPLGGTAAPPQEPSPGGEHLPNETGAASATKAKTPSKEASNKTPSKRSISSRFMSPARLLSLSASTAAPTLQGGEEGAAQNAAKSLLPAPPPDSSPASSPGKDAASPMHPSTDGGGLLLRTWPSGKVIGTFVAVFGFLAILLWYHP